jgi:DNA-binding NarL/FixJ family response regulator
MKLNDKVQKPRVIVVDDHPLVRAGIVSIVSESGIAELVAEASDARDILELIQKFQPNLVVMDISMPHSHGIDATRKIRESYPEVKVMILSIHEEEFYATEAIRAGASGYVMKEKAPETVLLAMERIFAGGVYMSERVTSKFLTFLGAGSKARGSIESLSKRQLEVFTGFGEGLNTRAVAEKMGVSVKTVETFRQQIKERLGINDLTQLMKHAVEWVGRHSNVADSEA